uniref:(northern house mosquito) hypothetical protein n=1 Tax=Culex pipiens TaxID=7175 RepID=A0A8D8DCP8_CULPI
MSSPSRVSMVLSAEQLLASRASTASAITIGRGAVTLLGISIARVNRNESIMGQLWSAATARTNHAANSTSQSLVSKFPAQLSQTKQHSTPPRGCTFSHPHQKSASKFFTQPFFQSSRFRAPSTQTRKLSISVDMAS